MQAHHMHHRFRQIRALTADDWRVILVSLVALPSTALVLRAAGLKRTTAWLSGPAFLVDGAGLDPAGEIESAVRVVRAVGIAANRGPYRANCLKRVLVSRWLLARRGIDSEIKFGATKDAAAFLAHAWIEVQGIPIGEGEGVEARYATFAARGEVE
jgi:hypothetical protein